ncbi:MAG: conjugal transfer protein TraB [Pseudopedobacter saltans]|uniref:Conjugal transfer protein TraB n=1 Tax=Pseudopedobacter saltans TaxID=151895 RepID=A0A2W5EZI5_9SPHI|nr:MAG: conjugal transfer protein TraB [Pseudopedobacter saltans]
MEKNNKSKITPDINEELMMNLMVDGVKKEGLQLPPEPPAEAPEKEEGKSQEIPQDKPAVKDKSRTKRVNEMDYESTFLKKSDTNARDGKTVYIRPAFHEKLTRIIQVIGGDKITIYAYLDNLLDHHFQEFSEQITNSYNNKYKPI